MHELGIMSRVLELAIQTAEQHGANKVVEISLQVGALSGILPHYLSSYFDMISTKTRAEGAHLNIEQSPAIFLCAECGAQSVYPEFGPDFICQSCGSDQLTLVSGSEFRVVTVAVR